MTALAATPVSWALPEATGAAILEAHLQGCPYLQGHLFYHLCPLGPGKLIEQLITRVSYSVERKRKEREEKLGWEGWAYPPLTWVSPLSLGTVSVWAGHPSVAPCLWQLTLLIPVQAGQQPRALKALGYKYIVGSLAKSLGVVSSCPGPQPRQSGNLLHGGGLENIFRSFCPGWLRATALTQCLMPWPLVAQALAACNSTSWFSSGRLPMSQRSSELGVLQTVCGLLTGLNYSCRLQNKGSLVASQTHSVSPLCVHSVYHT